MTDTAPATRNLSRWRHPEVVAWYAGESALQPAEAHLFARHLPDGAAVLDIGVGGGRTTAALLARAGRYVAIDYSDAMVEACRRRFPGVDVRRCDATDLAPFADSSFEAAVFAFNGIDCIETEAGRAACLREVARVLRPGGVFLFSSHNARVLGVWPDVSGARGVTDGVRQVREAVAMSVGVARNTVRTGVWRTGEGMVDDPAHGGLDCYVSTPAVMARHLRAAGLTPVEVVPAPTLRPRFAPLVRWYYYAARKS